MARKEKAKVKRGRGQPSKYDPKFCDTIIKYFDIKPYTMQEVSIVRKDGTEITREEMVPNDLPLFEGFAASIGVHIDTLNAWTRKHVDFSEAYAICKNLQKKILITNGLRGGYNANFAIFTAKNIADMRDTQVVENRGLGRMMEVLGGYRGKTEPSEN